MKKLALLALSGILLASMTGCGSNAQAAEAEYIYGQIDSVSGNDIVLLLADYNENAASGQEEADKQSEDSGSERKRPDKGEMPEGFDPSQFGGERPKRSSDSEDGETSEKPDTSKFSRRRSGSSKYTLIGEQEELRIPVGTTVTTAAGVETDFDVLKVGDYIRCSIETDSDGQNVITSVQIMEG